MSQLFSNIYLGVFDDYVKRVLKVKHYGRYVDDAYLLHEDKEYLKSLIPSIMSYLDCELGLKLNMKKVRIFNIRNDFKFLGACIRPYRRYVKNKTLKAFKHKVIDIEKQLYNGKTQKYYINENLAKLNSHLGYFSQFNTFKYKSKVLKNSFVNCYYLFDEEYTKAIIKNKE